MGDARLSASEGEVVVASPPTIGSPMYDVGMAAGTRITRIDDRAIATTNDVRDALAARKPGEQVRVTFIGRAGERSATMTLREDPNVEVVAFEDAGRTATPEQLTFRAAWVGTKQE